MEEKIAKLPTWAREHIKRLEELPKVAVEECAILRKRVQYLEGVNSRQKDRIEAMIEIFQCAAKGENEVAMAVQRIVEEYLVSDEE